METKTAIDFNVDTEHNRVTVEREFAAPLSKVWAAWTQSEQLDQWWAPKPWKSETKSFNFNEGGTWLYAMVGPDGEKQWSVGNFKNIKQQKSFTVDDGFSDENGKIDASMPQMHWVINFSEDNHVTTVSIDITADSKKDIDGILKMGFEEGFTKGLENLDELLKSTK